MAYQNHLFNIPAKAASAMGFAVAVAPDTTTDNQARPAPDVNTLILGMSIATVGTVGIGMTICRLGEAKAILAASTGPGAVLGVGSSNGALGPIAASGAGTAGTVRFQAGISRQAGVAGQIIGIIVDPRQIV